MTKSTTARNTYNRSNIPEEVQYILDIQHHGKNVPLLFIVGYMKALVRHRTELEQTIEPYHENTVHLQF